MERERERERENDDKKEERGGGKRNPTDEKWRETIQGRGRHRWKLSCR